MTHRTNKRKGGIGVSTRYILSQINKVFKTLFEEIKELREDNNNIDTIKYLDKTTERSTQSLLDQIKDSKYWYNDTEKHKKENIKWVITSIASLNGCLILDVLENSLFETAKLLIENDVDLKVYYTNGWICKHNPLNYYIEKDTTDKFLFDLLTKEQDVCWYYFDTRIRMPMGGIKHTKNPVEYLMENKLPNRFEKIGYLIEMMDKHNMKWSDKNKTVPFARCPILGSDYTFLMLQCKNPIDDDEENKKIIDMLLNKFKSEYINAVAVIVDTYKYNATALDLCKHETLKKYLIEKGAKTYNELNNEERKQIVDKRKRTLQAELDSLNRQQNYGGKSSKTRRNKSIRNKSIKRR